MTRKTLHALVAIVVGLVLLLFVMQRVDRDEIVVARSELLPDLQSVADSLTELTIAQPGGEESVTLHRREGQWVVSARGDYPADIGKLKELIIALAYAHIVEEKTSNPEQYAKLGVDDPEDGGKGTRVVLSGPNVSYSVVLGNTALRDSRYARIAEEATSYLIDRNPDIPQTAGDWLMPDIVDIPSSSVRRAVISHTDGEILTIEKSEQEQTDFDVVGIPEGRELSYATVGNGIAAALDSLELEDVQPLVDTPASGSAVFETWEGLKVTAGIAKTDDDNFWVTFTAESTGEDAGVAEQADAINARVTGWQYELADYKKNLLTRRWEDVLKATGE